MAENEVNVTEEVAASEETVSEETASSTDEKETVAAQPAKAESNPWKKLRDAKKEAERRAQKAQAEADKLRKELEEAKSNKPEAKAEEEEAPAIEEEEPEQPFDEKDLRLYVLENGLSELKGGIVDALHRFPGISFEDATQFAKSMKPKESKSKTEIALKGSSATPKTGKSTLKDMSEEDALKLPAEKYGEWLIANNDAALSNVRHYGRRV